VRTTLGRAAAPRVIVFGTLRKKCGRSVGRLSLGENDSCQDDNKQPLGHLYGLVLFLFREAGGSSSRQHNAWYLLDDKYALWYLSQIRALLSGEYQAMFELFAAFACESNRRGDLSSCDHCGDHSYLITKASAPVKASIPVRQSPAPVLGYIKVVAARWFRPKRAEDDLLRGLEFPVRLEGSLAEPETV
jgi:hypothetical protein